MIRTIAIAAALLLTAAGDPPDWTRPQTPFHLIGPIDYVGSRGIAAYLIRTPAGAILIDGTMEANAAMVQANIERVGVPIRDVKTILVSHAHFDHVGAVAALARASGARVVAGAGDVAALATGSAPGETRYEPVPYPPVAVARGVREGDTVALGGITLTAHATPGHTPGCTTWSMRVPDHGRTLDVVFPCSVSVAGNRLIGNRAYPGIVADYRASFARLAALPADVVLPAHPELADVRGRARSGRLIDPGLLPKIVANARTAFEEDLAKEAGR